jgi:hypothetical protein
MADDLGRRDLIRLTAGAVVAARAAGAVAQHKFFTPEEFKLVDELTETIIPADEKSGGARAAKVADYIDGCLAEAFAQEERDLWRNGLRKLGTQFLDAPPEQRTAMLVRMEAAKDEFFTALKNFTIKGYYTSKIGIHDDMEYQGNVFQQGDYAGELPS